MLACFLLSACATTPRYTEINSPSSKPPLPFFNQSLFGLANVIDEAQVSYLTDQQREDFFRFLSDPKFETTPRHQRVATYIGLVLDQFHFSDETLTAQLALASKSGNCLSLTMLTTAYAKLAGIDVSYQLLDRNLSTVLVTTNY